LILLRELLAPDGSIYVHLDQKMAFQAKILLDEIFGAKNFRGIITRRKCNPKNSTTKTYGNISDYLLFYSKTEEYVWNRPYEPWTATREAEEYPYVEPTSGRRFKKVPVHAPGTRNGETGEPWRGKLPPPGKHWQYRPSELDAMDARGEIYWSPTGNPRRKLYLDVSKGVAVQDIWWELRDAHNQMVRITGYPTEKNPALLERLIRASSNAGDLVLDCFAGSGTTLVVADQLGRRWIGVDNSEEALRTIFQRFTHGSERMGDFVSRPPAAAQRPAPALSLFDPEPEEPALAPAAAPSSTAFEHPITGFACYCAPELLSPSISRAWEANQARVGDE
jgi:adenine-specific DNA-methyltransferase